MPDRPGPASWILGALPVVACALAGSALAGLAGGAISAVALALVCGAVLAQALPAVAMRAEAAAAFLARWALQAGIVLLGLRLGLAATGDVILQALPVVAACVATALLVAALAWRLLGVERSLATLLAVGTSICGVTAITAMAPLIRARAESVGYATLCVALFGTAAMLVYPYLAHALFSDRPMLAGLFLGTSIHDTAQVAGAAMAYDARWGPGPALEAATVAKLLRNLSMVLILPLAAMFVAAGDPAARQTGGRALLPVPGFVLAFVAMSGLRTAIDLQRPALAADTVTLIDATLAGAGQLSLGCLLLAMAAVGLRMRLGGLRAIGLRPLLLGLASALAVGAASILTIGLLHPPG
jgi:uncharacterized integral membrane protein (TIGR00698 family)